jgi:hypothetical protein
MTLPNQGTLSKKPQNQMDSTVTQVLESLLSKLEDLSTGPSTAIKIINESISKTCANVNYYFFCIYSGIV